MDHAFIEQQRLRLEELRRELQATEARHREKEQTYTAKQQNEVREYEDEAQDVTRSEFYQAVDNVDSRRLRAVERALQKIGEGTYGLSDLSGETIPKDRLDAVPEAVLTLEEEKQAERQAK